MLTDIGHIYEVSKAFIIKETSKHPGYFEYQQYLKSVGKTYLKEKEDILSYDVDIQVNDEGDVVTVLKEFDRRGNPTTGGSSFLVTRILGQHCPVTDYFNGTYIAICSAIPGTHCSELNVIRQGVNYAFYIHIINVTNVVIERKQVCVNHTPSLQYVELANLRKVATWTQEAFNITNLTHHYGVPVKLLTSKEICEFVANNFSNIIMIGASHMRYSFDYFLENCFNVNESLTKKHGDFEIENVKYIRLNFGNKLKQIVKREMKVSSNLTESLYILQFGAHDLSDHKLEYTMNESIRSFINSIGDLSASGAKVLVTSTPPYPDRMTHVKNTGFRNNFIISAFNYNKKRANLMYFDTFNAILPWQNSDITCGCHYLCRIPSQGMKGNIGLQVFRLMMTEAFKV